MLASLLSHTVLLLGAFLLGGALPLGARASVIPDHRQFVGSPVLFVLRRQRRRQSLIAGTTQQGRHSGDDHIKFKILTLGDRTIPYSFYTTHNRDEGD